MSLLLSYLFVMCLFGVTIQDSAGQDGQGKEQGHTYQLLHHLSTVLEQMTILLDDMDTETSKSEQIADQVNQQILSLNQTLVHQIDRVEERMSEKMDRMNEGVEEMSEMLGVFVANITSGQLTVKAEVEEENRTVTKQTLAGSLCGSILLPHPASTSDGSSVLCFLSKDNPVHAQLLDKPCHELIWGLPGYPNLMALTNARGNYGCRRGNRGIDDPSLALCQVGHGQDFALSYRGCSPACDTLAVCIQYPLDSVPTPGGSSLSACGPNMREMPLSHNQQLRGWVGCMFEREQSQLLRMSCRNVMASLGLSGEIEFGCYRSSKSLDSASWRRACRKNYQPSLVLSQCNHCMTMALCYRKE